MQRIEVCGGIATGKTSLARCLTYDDAYQFVEEQFRKVPFWEKFYAAPDKYAFEKNVSFLLFHSDSIRDAMSDPRPAVCDFAMFQDLSYAALDSPRDLQIIRSIYEKLMDRLPHPSLIIQLKCAPETQLDRVRRRGRVPEQSITKDYLARLNREIESSLKSMRQEQKIDIITIDSDEMDFVTNPQALALTSELTDRIETIKSVSQLATR